MHLSCQKQAEKYLKGTILAILFKKPTYLKNPWVFSFKKPILPAGFLNGFFKWVFYLIQPWGGGSTEFGKFQMFFCFFYDCIPKWTFLVKGAGQLNIKLLGP